MQEYPIEKNSKKYFTISAWAVPICVAIFLIAVSFSNFLLFHTLAEFFAISIAILTCVVAWNMYPFTRNHYLMFLGGGYFWIGILDLFHTMSYEGMNVFPDGGANMGVQFWVGTRYLEALILLSAPWFLTHELNRIRSFFIFAAIAILIIFSVQAGVFPEGFIPGKGLTAFKIYSEYLIILILTAAIYYLYLKREFLEPRIVNVLIVSIIFTMAAELAFTFYVSVYGLSNLAGHIFKILSFWLIFQAIIRTTLQEPFLAMSRGATTYDAIPDATIVVDENGVIRQANEMAVQLSEQKSKEIIGKSNHDIFHPQNLKVENCLVCQAIVNNQELKGLELEDKGAGRWFDYSLSHIVGASSLDGTVEVIRDITKRKESEVKMSELDVLKNTIVDNLPLMLFVKDANDHRYIEWNKAAEELTGILKEEILGNTDFKFWPKEQAEFFIKKDDEVMGSGALLEINQEPITTKQKGTRTLHTKKIPIFDKDGKGKYLLGLSEDITDKLKTEEMLSRSQKMDAVGQMSGGIAHDFNNQLGVILGYVELLSEQNLPDKQTTWLNAVLVAARRCADLTQQLLIFSRNGEVDKEVINVNSTIKNMEAIIERTLTPEVKINYFFTNDIWMTEVNAGGFKDAILNLILNSRDAMPGGGELSIETSNIVVNEKSAALFSNIQQGEYIEIMISDNGQGMSQETYEHVFEPFYTTKDVGKGTGLGLSMVYGFVQRYGGDVSLDTKLGEGATFRIYLPRTVDSIPFEVGTESNEFPQGHESILVVDDEVALLNYAEQVLQGLGYKVFSAKNAQEALSILESSKIDLLFTDVVMPGGINGYELAEKACKQHPKLKVLITSGYADKFGNNEEYEKHGFELVSKPYDRLEIAEKIRQLLAE